MITSVFSIAKRTYLYYIKVWCMADLTVDLLVTHELINTYLHEDSSGLESFTGELNQRINL